MPMVPEDDPILTARRHTRSALAAIAKAIAATDRARAKLAEEQDDDASARERRLPETGPIAI